MRTMHIIINNEFEFDARSTKMTSVKRKAGEDEPERKGKKPRTEPESNAGVVDEAKIDAFFTAWKGTVPPDIPVDERVTSRAYNGPLALITNAVDKLFYIQDLIDHINADLKGYEMDTKLDIWTLAPLGRELATGKPTIFQFDLRNQTDMFHNLMYRHFPIYWMSIFGTKVEWNSFFDSIDSRGDIPRFRFPHTTMTHKPLKPQMLSLFHHADFWEKYPFLSRQRKPLLLRLQDAFDARVGLYDSQHDTTSDEYGSARVPMFARVLHNDVWSAVQGDILLSEKYGRTWSIERPPRELGVVRQFFADHYFAPYANVSKLGMQKWQEEEVRAAQDAIEEMNEEEKKENIEALASWLKQRELNDKFRGESLAAADTKRNKSVIALPTVRVLSSDESIRQLRKGPKQNQSTGLASLESDYFPDDDLVVLEPPDARSVLIDFSPLTSRTNHLRSPVPIFLYNTLLAMARSVSESKRSNTVELMNLRTFYLPQKMKSIWRSLKVTYQQAIDDAAVLMATGVMSGVFSIWTESTILAWSHQLMNILTNDFPAVKEQTDFISESGYPARVNQSKLELDIMKRRLMIQESAFRASEILRWMVASRDEAKNGVMKWKGMPSSSSADSKSEAPQHSGPAAMDVSTSLNAGNTSRCFII